jgi:hypothetical protein
MLIDIMMSIDIELFTESEYIQQMFWIILNK